MPLAPLPAPTLSVSGPTATPSFAWTWPAGRTYDVALQVSSNGTDWRRVSPVFSQSTTTYLNDEGVTGQQYRLTVMSLDNRTMASNVVTL